MLRNFDVVHCPLCGGEIKKNAASCPHCGSDDKTGWSPDTYLDGIDLPDDVSYEDIRQEEFGTGFSHRGKPYRLLFIITGSVLMAVLIGGILLALR